MAVNAYFDATGRGTPGQLRDGSVIGVVRDSNTGANAAFGWKIRARYYKGKLIADFFHFLTAETPLSDSETYTVRGRETLLASSAIIAAFGTTGINLFATEADLAALGLAPGKVIPDTVSDEEIPYELTADLQVRKKDLALSDQDFANTIQQASINSALVAGAAGAAAPATSSNLLGFNVNWTKVIQVALVAAVLIGIYKFAQNQDWI